MSLGLTGDLGGSGIGQALHGTYLIGLNGTAGQLHAMIVDEFPAVSGDSGQVTAGQTATFTADGNGLDPGDDGDAGEIGLDIYDPGGNPVYWGYIDDISEYSVEFTVSPPPGAAVGVYTAYLDLCGLSFFGDDPEEGEGDCEAGPVEFEVAASQGEQGQCGDPGDQRNTITTEYITYNVTDSSIAGKGSAFVPQCAWFTQTGQSAYYNFQQLGNIGKQPYAWALIKNPLTVNMNNGYGLDDWTNLLWQAGWGSSQIILSTYRPPAYNEQKEGAANSRHQFGDAVDIQNVSQTQAEHDAKVCLASLNEAVVLSPSGGGVVSCPDWMTYDAAADYVEPTNLACGLRCVHADWRNHDYNVYIH